MPPGKNLKHYLPDNSLKQVQKLQNEENSSFEKKFQITKKKQRKADAASRHFFSIIFHLKNGTHFISA